MDKRKKERTQPTANSQQHPPHTHTQARWGLTALVNMLPGHRLSATPPAQKAPKSTNEGKKKDENNKRHLLVK